MSVLQSMTDLTGSLLSPNKKLTVGISNTQGVSLAARHWIGNNIAKNHRLLRANHMPERPFASGTYSRYVPIVFLYLPMYV